MTDDQVGSRVSSYIAQYHGVLNKQKPESWKKSILINFKVQLTFLELLYLKTISFAPRYKTGKK